MRIRDIRKKHLCWINGHEIEVIKVQGVPICKRCKKCGKILGWFD